MYACVVMLHYIPVFIFLSKVMVLSSVAGSPPWLHGYSERGEGDFPAECVQFTGQQQQQQQQQQQRRQQQQQRQQQQHRPPPPTPAPRTSLQRPTPTAPPPSATGDQKPAPKEKKHKKKSKKSIAASAPNDTPLQSRHAAIDESMIDQVKIILPRCFPLFEILHICVYIRRCCH